jgi:Amt family ammonium transporter
MGNLTPPPQEVPNGALCVRTPTLKRNMWRTTHTHPNSRACPALRDTGTTAYVLTCASLVLLMTPALALFYGGFVGPNMAISTMLMSFAALGVITTQWSLLTYSLAFGTHSNAAVDPYIGGTSFAAYSELSWGNNLRAGTAIPEQANFAYQLAFAAVTSAVISGGVVGRITYGAWCTFIALWHVIVYVPLAHWIFYSGGWLAKNGVLDFAGGLVVETNSGVSAFVLAAWVSWATRRAITAAAPRKVSAGGGGGGTAAPSAADDEVEAATSAINAPWLVLKARKPHNVPFILLGAGLLLFGWLGFNSASGLTTGFRASRAWVNTALSAATGMLGWGVAESVWAGGRGLFSGLPSAVGCATGLVVGLVAITPACGFVSAMSSLVIGFATALIAFHVDLFLRARCSCVDDTLSVFVGHGVGGMVGIFATGLVANVDEMSPSNGAVYGNGAQLGWQVAGILVTVAVSAAGTSIAWGATTAIFHALRLPSLMPPAHALDPDTSLHGERAYSPVATEGGSGGSGSVHAGKVWTEAAIVALVRRELKARAGAVVLEVRAPAAEGARNTASAVTGAAQP